MSRKASEWRLVSVIFRVSFGKVFGEHLVIHHYKLTRKKKAQLHLIYHKERKKWHEERNEPVPDGDAIWPCTQLEVKFNNNTS